MTGAPDGETVVLDVTQLEALLATTFTIGLDVGRGKEKGIATQVDDAHPRPGEDENRP